jgi:hypothetical protein
VPSTTRRCPSPTLELAETLYNKTKQRKGWINITIQPSNFQTPVGGGAYHAVGGGAPGSTLFDFGNAGRAARDYSPPRPGETIRMIAGVPNEYYGICRFWRAQGTPDCHTDATHTEANSRRGGGRGGGGGGGGAAARTAAPATTPAPAPGTAGYTFTFQTLN